MITMKVAIIGCGIAGLQCATVLNKLNVNFTVYESKSTFGGRISSRTVGKSLLPTGPMWVHGTSDNPLFDICKNLDLFTSFPGQNNFIHLIEPEINYEYKRTISTVLSDYYNKNTQTIFYKVHDLIIEMLDHVSELTTKEVNQFNDNLGQYYKHHLLSKLKSLFPNDLELKEAEAAVKCMLLFISNVDGTDSLDNVSLLGSCQYKEGIGQIYVAKGFDSLTKHLFDNLPLESVKFNLECTKITSSNKGVFIELNNDLQSHFDHVIVTTPLGFLKRHHSTLFDPKLPTTKLRAMESIESGIIDKIFLVFDGPVFENNIKHTWLLNSQDTKSWTDGIFCISSISNDSSILLTWLGGNYARDMEACSDDEVASKLLQILRKKLGKSVPQLKSLIRTKFACDPDLLGSYTFYKPGADLNAISILSEPVYNDDKKPIILFAGEHTHPDYFSTVHGAYLSGEREALRLQEYYNLTMPVSIHSSL